jgi:L-ascorbate metabolism protein UlaG (beta-lactamase superfamily)
LRLGGQVVVTDPIWSPSISGAVRRLVLPGVELAAMPPIDIVLVTHDHRDHMDMPTLAQLPNTATYLTGLGNGARLVKLGHANVVELDWWQSHRIGELEFTFVPARHWSMRMPWNRNDALWGGFVVRGPEGVAYHSGDTAWGDHFAEIAAKCPPIDWAMLPIGGYAPRGSWSRNASIRSKRARIRRVAAQPARDAGVRSVDRRSGRRASRDCARGPSVGCPAAVDSGVGEPRALR